MRFKVNLRYTIFQSVARKCSTAVFATKWSAGVTQEMNLLHAGDNAHKQGIHTGLEIKGRCHKKLTGQQWRHKNLCPPTKIAPQKNPWKIKTRPRIQSVHSTLNWFSKLSSIKLNAKSIFQPGLIQTEKNWVNLNDMCVCNEKRNCVFADRGLVKSQLFTNSPYVFVMVCKRNIQVDELAPIWKGLCAYWLKTVESWSQRCQLKFNCNVEF